MNRLLSSLVPLGLALGFTLVHADEKVFLKGKEFKTVIKKESGLGIQSDTFVPAEDIVDIEYDVLPFAVRTAVYRPARGLEKDSQEKEKDRKLNILKALENYEDSLAKITGAGQENARRNIEFRIAVLRTRLHAEYNQSIKAASDKLEDFKKKHPDSWQIARCLRMLASLQLAEKKYAQAEKTYQELSQAPVADEVKHEAEFLAAQVNLSAGKFNEAMASMQSLSKKLPKDNRFGMRARVAEAECLAAANKADDANKLLRQILKDSTDKTLKAMAYNTLGKNLYKQGQLKEARWEFLWVDVVYNQDKGEHAKALYHLGHIFEKLGDADRAKECRDQLGDRMYAGLEYQQKLTEEEKK